MSEPLTDREMIEQYQAATDCFPESLLIRMHTIMAGKGRADTLANRVELLVCAVERVREFVEMAGLTE